MITYADLFTSNIFLITNYTVGGEAVLANELLMRVLHTALMVERKRRQFRLVGYVFLPDHVHLLLEPSGTVVLDQSVKAIYQQFQIDYQQIVGIPGELLLWESHYQVHRVADGDELAFRLDSIHYAPVHQHLVDKPEQWPYSSYRGWLAQGLYASEWGWSLPTHLAEKRWR